MLTLAAIIFVGQVVDSQETQAPSAAPQQEPHNNIRRAIYWKNLSYTCEGGIKISVALNNNTLAKVLFRNHQYLLKQTPSADGERYSDGQLLWWSKGEGGFLQEDTPDGDGKMLAKDCKLEQTTAPTMAVTGTVAYLEKIALPPQAVIELQLRELPVADAREHATLVMEQKIALGNRQVPVSFELKVDVGKISPKRAYSLTARILVNDTTWFYSAHGYLVLTQGNPSHVDMILDRAGTDAKAKP
jgi:putative lipoprotein